jgi:hypothetical protein
MSASEHSHTLLLKTFQSINSATMMILGKTLLAGSALAHIRDKFRFVACKANQTQLPK